MRNRGLAALLGLAALAAVLALVDAGGIDSADLAVCGCGRSLVACGHARGLTPGMASGARPATAAWWPGIRRSYVHG